MNTFLKENLLYVIIHILSFGFLSPLVFLNDTNVSLSTLLYFLLVSTVMLIAALLAKYNQSKNFYKWLEDDSKTDFPDQYGTSYTCRALKRKMDRINAKNSNLVASYKLKYSNYLSYINRWVHQLKTPLSVLYLIYQENEDNEVISDIQRETDKIMAGLYTALYYSRSQGFTNDLNFRLLKVESMIKDVINELKRWFIRENVYPKIYVDPNFEISTDEKWFKFIIYQLLTNAIKYSKEASEEVEISLEGKKLHIKDQGLGIDKKDIKRIFEQFYTGENGRIKGESTGIGLYLVKQVCEKLNYPLSVESQKGIGTTISIELH